jgi:hypothetical protein
VQDASLHDAPLLIPLLIHQHPSLHIRDLAEFFNVTQTGQGVLHSKGLQILFSPSLQILIFIAIKKPPVWEVNFLHLVLRLCKSSSRWRGNKGNEQK